MTHSILFRREILSKSRFEEREETFGHNFSEERGDRDGSSGRGIRGFRDSNNSVNEEARGKPRSQNERINAKTKKSEDEMIIRDTSLQ
jgi:hypothetical protein